MKITKAYINKLEREARSILSKRNVTNKDLKRATFLIATRDRYAEQMGMEEIWSKLF